MWVLWGQRQEALGGGEQSMCTALLHLSWNISKVQYMLSKLTVNS